MTKRGPNTKENLQNQRKPSKQSKEYKKTRKSQNDGGDDGVYLLAKTTTEENLENICSSCYDAPHRGTMALLGDQADETHRISYNFELYLPIVSRWTYRATMAC
ncbi:hypothetical protein QL285_058707 [Trifolium repens]|nr:hypothetical protein QL285_058707 [Trifolium repens]